jgi:hypothetical protein
VFLFNTGELWSIDSYLLKTTAPGRYIPTIENYFRTALEQYTARLLTLGLNPPFRWIAGMENLKGRGIAPTGRMAEYRAPIGKCLVDVIVDEGTHSTGAPSAKSLRPFFVKLFDSCGVQPPTSLDA